MIQKDASSHLEKEEDLSSGAESDVTDDVHRVKVHYRYSQLLDWVYN